MFIDFPSPSYPIEGMEGVSIPKMYRVRQLYDDYSIASAPECAARNRKAACRGGYLREKDCNNCRSRGIPGYADIMKAICRAIESRGACRLLCPPWAAGGALRLRVSAPSLQNTVVTEQNVGVPIVSSMETVNTVLSAICRCGAIKTRLRRMAYLFSTRLSRTRISAQGRKRLCKMVAIGLGKHRGAFRVSTRPDSRILPRICRKAASALAATGKLIGGIGVVQNAYDRICAVKAAPAERMIELDASLLQLARKDRPVQVRLAGCSYNRADRKEYSGAGFDPNIVEGSIRGCPASMTFCGLKSL